jgi:hypothetical protein
LFHARAESREKPPGNLASQRLTSRRDWRYDDVGNVIETYEHAGDFKKPANPRFLKTFLFFENFVPQIP